MKKSRNNESFSSFKFMLVFLSGAPGVGKTTVGKILSQKLSLKFVETDELIQKKTGKSIPDLFKQGEIYFRAVEANVIKEVVENFDNAVVSLGGGAVTIKENLHLIRNKGYVVNLTAKYETILKRLESDTTRPLIQGDKAKKIKELLIEREKFYRICDFYVDTTEITPEVAADRIVDFLSVAKNSDIVRVNLYERSYDVIVGKVHHKLIRNRIERNFRDIKKVVLVTSPSIKYIEYNGFSPYEDIKSIFRDFGEVIEIELPEGENTKDILYAIYLWNTFTEIELKKSDLIIIVGGGVLGDLVGFVCANYLRGIKYINVPTTLLAQVDSSIGGKTGVNTEKAKNIIGIIYQPFLVLSDTDFIKTLPQTEFISGLGEVIKYAISCDRELFSMLITESEKLLSRDEKVLKDVVSRCARIKADVVSQDENEEKGLRFILNFGHTIGHAFEASYNYKIPHGIAVAKGCLAEIKISDRILGKNIYPQALEIVKKIGIDDKIEIPDKQKFISALKIDKKTRGNYLNFILIEDIGKFSIERIKIDDFLKVMNETLGIF